MEENEKKDKKKIKVVVYSLNVPAFVGFIATVVLTAILLCEIISRYN